MRNYYFGASSVSLAKYEIDNSNMNL